MYETLLFAGLQGGAEASNPEDRLSRRQPQVPADGAAEHQSGAADPGIAVHANRLASIHMLYDRGDQPVERIHIFGHAEVGDGVVYPFQAGPAAGGTKSRSGFGQGNQAADAPRVQVCKIPGGAGIGSGWSESRAVYLIGNGRAGKPAGDYPGKIRDQMFIPS